MKIECRTGLILIHPNKKEVLLMKRSPERKRDPNLISTLGGKTELELGEAEDLQKSLLRELSEESHITLDQISDLKLKLTVLTTRPDLLSIICWHTGVLLSVPNNLDSNEGALNFYPIDNLPLAEFTKNAKVSIPFVLKHYQNDTQFIGIINSDGQLTATEK